jgi:hypothetical protein
MKKNAVVLTVLALATAALAAGIAIATPGSGVTSTIVARGVAMETSRREATSRMTP